MSTQGCLDFETPSEPAPCDPKLAEPLRRIQYVHNVALVHRLLRGPIGSDELERHSEGWGKRGSARLLDVKRWLQYLGQEKPIQRTKIDATRGLYVWAFTDEARDLARREMGGKAC